MMKKDNTNKNISAGDHSVVIGGDVQGSNIVIGSNNTVSNNIVNLTPLFREIYKNLDAQKDIAPDKKEDVKAELEEIKTALEEPKPDESFLTRRFRNLKRMAPDITDVAIETLKNPISGVAEVVKKISKKMSEEANAK
jgi:hypothetical protein